MCFAQICERKFIFVLGSLATSIGLENPFRYNSHFANGIGYYYDNENEPYYLQSRYYDAGIGRFINADAGIDCRTNIGTNLFVYCYNNHIMYYDDDGRLPKSSISRVNYDTIKFQISDKLSNIATYLMINLTVELIGAAICAFIPGAQAAALALGISAALKGLAVYRIDKYGGSRSVYMYAQVRYGINTVKKSYTFWTL